MKIPTLGHRLMLPAATLMLTAAAPLIQGDPIPGRDVILQGDPSGLTVASTTDRSGGVQLTAQPGRYALMLPNAQTLRVPAVARIEVGRTVLTTGTIQPGERGNVYFLNHEGQRLMFTVPRGTPVRIRLTEGAPAAQRTGTPPTPPPASPGPVPADYDGDGRADTRTNPGTPTPAPRGA